MSLKLKINPIREYLGLIIYPIKPSEGLFFLIKSRETTGIPLKGRKACRITVDQKKLIFWLPQLKPLFSRQGPFKNKKIELHKLIVKMFLNTFYF
jgi:hypothetical protein